jgi:hypothetical protein
MATLAGAMQETLLPSPRVARVVQLQRNHSLNLPPTTMIGFQTKQLPPRMDKRSSNNKLLRDCPPRHHMDRHDNSNSNKKAMRRHSTGKRSSKTHKCSSKTHKCRAPTNHMDTVIQDHSHLLSVRVTLILQR